MRVNHNHFTRLSFDQRLDDREEIIFTLDRVRRPDEFESLTDGVDGWINDPQLQLQRFFRIADTGRVESR